MVRNKGTQMKGGVSAGSGDDQVSVSRRPRDIEVTNDGDKVFDMLEEHLREQNTYSPFPSPGVLSLLLFSSVSCA